MFNRIFSTSFYSIVSRFFSTGITLFIIFFISRFLNKQALGLYGIAFFFFQLFAVLSYQGLDVFLAKEVAFKRESPADLSKLGNEFMVSIVFGTTFSVLLMLVFNLFYHKIGFTLMVLSLLAGVLYALERNLGGILLGKEKVSLDAFYMIISFFFVVGLLLLIKGKISIEIIFLVRILSLAIGVVGRWAAVSIHMPVKKISRKLEFFAETRFYWFLVLCVFAERHADIFILSFFIKEELLGGYFLSLSIYRTMCLLVEVLAQALTPFISRVYQGRENIKFHSFIYSLFLVSLIFGLLLGGFLFLFRDFMVFLFNKNLVATCSPFLKILSFLIPLKVVIFMLGSVLSSTIYQRVRFYIYLYASILFVVLLPVMIRSFAALGAIYARIFFEVLVLAATSYFIFRKAARENK